MIAGSTAVCGNPRNPLETLMTRIDDPGITDKATAPFTGFILASTASLGGRDGREPPCRSQEPRDDSQGRDEDRRRPSRPVPPPEVVNAEMLPRQPADALDGPPFTTVKAWAIADGRTGEVLWGHREKEPLEMASTTKIMTALIVVRLMAKDPKVGDEMVTFSKRADRTIGSSVGRPRGRAAAGARTALRAAAALGQRRGRGVRRAFRRTAEAARRRARSRTTRSPGSSPR